MTTMCHLERSREISPCATLSRDDMRGSLLPVRSILFEYDQPLLAPVLQHLPHGIVVHIGTLYRYRMLHSLLERELDIQSLKDRVILATLLSLPVQTACIVATREGVLDTVTEEIEGILNERVGYHVIDLQHRGRLRLQ